MHLNLPLLNFDACAAVDSTGHQGCWNDSDNLTPQLSSEPQTPTCAGTQFLLDFRKEMSAPEIANKGLRDYNNCMNDSEKDNPTTKQPPHNDSNEDSSYNTDGVKGARFTSTSSSNDSLESVTDLIFGENVIANLRFSNMDASGSLDHDIQTSTLVSSANGNKSLVCHNNEESSTVKVNKDRTETPKEKNKLGEKESMLDSAHHIEKKNDDFSDVS